MERARGERGGARGLSQPLSQCKHVLIEIRSSGYNSFADVAARPSLSFSLYRSSLAVPYPYEMSPSGPRRPGSFPQALASRDCASLAVAFHWLHAGLLPLRLRTFRFEGKRDVKVSCRILKRGNPILLFGRRLGIMYNFV